MAAPTYTLGCDVARTGLGLAIVSADGTIVHTLRRAYAGDAGIAAPGDPLDWWRAARTGIKELLRRASVSCEQIRCIGVTGDEACVAIDEEGNSLTPATLGFDPQAEESAAAISQIIGARSLYNLSGAVASNRAMAAKLLSLKDLHRRAWHDLRHVLSAKDFLRFKLTGTIATDPSEASGSLLFNPKTRAWSKQLLTQLDISPDLLPVIGDGKTIAGRVSESAARESGLAAGTPVIAGASHPAALALATGAFRGPATIIELGGRGDLVLVGPDVVRDPNRLLISGCHSVPAAWTLHLRDASGASGVEWMLERILASEATQARRSQREPLDALAEFASEAAPGADGLLAIPTVSGLSITNLRPSHTRSHLSRAILEGGALACRTLIGTLPGNRLEHDELLLAGPGAANPLWCQIACDILGRPVKALATSEPCAAGVAILATTAVGMQKSLDDARTRLVRHLTGYSPRRVATDAYRDLAPSFHTIAGLPAPSAAGADAPIDDE